MPTTSMSLIEQSLNGIVLRLYARARAEPSAFSDDGIAVVDDPVKVDLILKAPDQFRKNYSLLSILGSSRFSAHGAEWEQRRNLTQPNYLRAAHSSNRNSIRSVYENKLSSCQSLAPSAIQQALLEAAITVFFRALNCSVDPGPLLAFFSRIRPILKMAQYLSWIGAESSERSELAEKAQSALQEYREAVELSPDLLKLLNRFRQEGGSIPGFLPHDELLMNFFAGIETSAATLGWAITCLAPDTRVQERVYQEAVQEEAPKPYLDCFLNETMRYFPAIPFVIRQVAEATSLDGVELRADSLVLLSIIGIHHDRQYWRAPDVFDTARKEFLNNTFDRRAFIPFLTGPRMCGGARLARLELTEGLKAFLRLYSVSGGTAEFSFDYGLAMRPNSWPEIEIRRRR